MRWFRNAEKNNTLDERFLKNRSQGSCPVDVTQSHTMPCFVLFFIVSETESSLHLYIQQLVTLIVLGLRNVLMEYYVYMYSLKDCYLFFIFIYFIFQKGDI